MVAKLGNLNGSSKVAQNVAQKVAQNGSSLSQMVAQNCNSNR